MSSTSYFEVKVLENPDPRGGLAVGVCNHVPQDAEIHTIRLTNSVLYNSNNGLVGDAFGAEDVAKGLQLNKGSSLGIKHDLATHSLTWYLNRQPVGTCQFKVDMVENMRVMYPCFALYVPNQEISVAFHIDPPTGTRSRPEAIPPSLPEGGEEA